MCRFLAYRGPEILLDELLYQPAHSLISQSYKAQEREEPLNGDGFGVGWYVKGNPRPCLYTRITPAWNDRNLKSLSEHIYTPCLFAHVRAASPGMRVSEVNCHPFAYQRFLWMHNGFVGGFQQIKRRLRESLPDPLYSMIEGTTDSEHVFALFLHYLGNLDSQISASRLAEGLARTIFQLEEWRTEAEVSLDSHCNFAVTDGVSMAAIRYVSNPWQEPISLYFSVGKKYECHNGKCHLIEAPCRFHSVILASERLTARDEDWVRVAPNHLISVEPDPSVRLQLLDEFSGDFPRRA